MSTRALEVGVAVPGAALRTLASSRSADYPVFLDSAAQGPLTRYSMLAAAPTATLSRDAHGRLTGRNVAVHSGGFLDNLDRWYAREATSSAASDGAPFRGGWMVYLGYEVAGEIEPSLRLPAAQSPYSAFALRVPHMRPAG